MECECEDVWSRRRSRWKQEDGGRGGGGDRWSSRGREEPQAQRPKGIMGKTKAHRFSEFRSWKSFYGCTQPLQGIHTLFTHLTSQFIPYESVYSFIIVFEQMSWRTTLSLAFQSIGVVYGDIGTSPLYVYASTFTNEIKHEDDILGVLSIIIYTIFLIPLLKYVFIVLWANDNGNGTILSLNIPSQLSTTSLSSCSNKVVEFLTQNKTRSVCFGFRVKFVLSWNLDGRPL